MAMKDAIGTMLLFFCHLKYLNFQEVFILSEEDGEPNSHKRRHWSYVNKKKWRRMNNFHWDRWLMVVDKSTHTQVRKRIKSVRYQLRKIVYIAL